MPGAVQTQGRSRSNSFQLMLDLEKKMVIHRAHASTNHSLSSSQAGSVPPSPAPQPRRFELVPKDGKKAPPPVRNYGPVPPPLFYNIAPPAAAESPAVFQRKLIKDPGHSRGASVPAHKTVAFVFPPDVEEERSVCQSPSWEAYGRRKQEKKERKEEKKEEKREERRGREPEINENKPRGRRLSKAPPLSQGLARSQTDPVSPPKQKTRSSSLLGISIGNKDNRDARDEPSEKPRRGRSGSLTSAIRHSFEIRRASFDQTSPSGFLGGVKLDKKKQDFRQQVVEDQSKGNSTVHPALRKSFLGVGSFTPLKTPPQPAQDKEADAQRRTYPPISLQTSSARNQAMMSPKSPSKRDSFSSANIYLWSARAKKKAAKAADECAVVDTEDELEEPIKNAPSVEESIYVKETGLTRRGGLHIKTGPPATLEAKISARDLGADKASNGNGVIKPLNVADKDRSSKATETLRLETQPERHTATEQKDKTPYPPSSTKTRSRHGSTASVSSIPPEPPRRNSKRNSLGLLSRSQPQSPIEATKNEPTRASKESLRPRLDRKAVGAGKTSSEKRNATPPSIRYENTAPGVRPTPFPVDSPTSPTSKFNFKDTARSTFSRGSGSQSSTSPTSTTSSISKGYSPTLPASPLKNEAMILPRTDVQKTTKQPDAGLASSQIKISRRLAEHIAPSTAQSSDIWRPTTSSSDESSYSDALQSASPPSTPDSSPPQSDSEHLPHMAGGKQSQYSPCWSATSSPQFPPCDRFQLSDAPQTDEELDPIEAASRKVMEAFANANLRSPPHSRHDFTSSDESSMMSPLTQAQPRLRHREKSKGRMRPSELQTDNLPQYSRPKASKSTPNLDARGQKSAVAIPESSMKSSRHGPQGGDRVGKLFVVCCECKRYHDIPIKLYKAMANPEAVFTSSEAMGFEGKVSMTVKCSWCEHEMSTKCCPGVSGILAIKERLH
ncbi:hypothetical protein EDB80DRAFT_879291 [Ilyonectria destructans]|nr:hypothetical protein EDB80DRAFT_879291 [Ilyonectria destructans]